VASPDERRAVGRDRHGSQALVQDDENPPAVGLDAPFDLFARVPPRRDDGGRAMDRGGDRVGPGNEDHGGSRVDVRARDLEIDWDVDEEESWEETVRESAASARNAKAIDLETVGGMDMEASMEKRARNTRKPLTTPTHSGSNSTPVPRCFRTGNQGLITALMTASRSMSSRA